MDFKGIKINRPIFIKNIWRSEKTAGCRARASGWQLVIDPRVQGLKKQRIQGNTSKEGVKHATG
jgi:hypothetical protein